MDELKTCIPRLCQKCRVSSSQVQIGLDMKVVADSQGIEPQSEGAMLLSGMSMRPIAPCAKVIDDRFLWIYVPCTQLIKDVDRLHFEGSPEEYLHCGRRDASRQPHDLLNTRASICWTDQLAWLAECAG
jgi:hypothetical protein